MAQYSEWTEDGILYFRRGARDGYNVVDQTITSPGQTTGFNGTKGVDWNMISRSRLPT